MPRKLRLEKQGMLYHIICRGQRKNPIFFSKSDMKKYCQIVNYCLTQYDIQILAYCLMRNHVHLLVRRNSMPLADFMHRVNTLYAMYFNDKYKLVGHVFQGRYKAYPVLRERYYYSVMNYIHNNPLKAGLVDKQCDYAYSSAHIYERKKSNSAKIAITQFNGNQTVIKDIESYYNHKDYYIGTKSEYQKLDKRNKRIAHVVFTERRSENQEPLERVFNRLCINLDINPFDIKNSKWKREYNKKREYIIYQLYKLGYSQANIAGFLHMSQSYLSKILKKRTKS